MKDQRARRGGRLGDRDAGRWLGGAWWLTVLVPVVVAWSRVRLGVHTRGQVIAGAALGVVVALVWLPLLR